MWLYFLLFFISYLFLGCVTLLYFDRLSKTFIKFIFLSFICSITLMSYFKIYNFLELFFMLHIIFLLCMTIDQIENKI